MARFPKRPGVFCVQIGTEREDRLDFNSRDATSLEDAFGHAREALALNPDFEWDTIIIWNGHSAADLQQMSSELEEKQRSSGDHL